MRLSNTVAWMSALVEQLMPKFYRNRLGETLAYAGVDTKPGRWLISSLLNAVSLGMLVSIILHWLIKVDPFVGLRFLLPVPVIALVFMVAMYNVLLYYGLKKAVQIEEALPDALQLIAANIRADIPVHKALILAARPEFGALGEQLDRVGDEILSGSSVDAAFRRFSKRVKSPLVQRISTLITESLESGHDLAGLMEQIAHDVRSFKILEAEAKAEISSYVVFIVMAVLIIAPVLYSISISFVDLSQAVKAELDVGELASTISGKGGSLSQWILAESSITGDTLALFAAANLFISALVAAMVISVLHTGESLQKMPYIPIFIVIAVGVFVVALTVMRTILLGMFG